MFAHILLVPLFAAAIVPQGGGIPSTPQSNPERTATEAFADAARKIDEASNFYAKYELEADEFEGTIQFAYEAPDRAHLRSAMPGVEMQMWILEGRISARFRTEEGSSYADFDLAADNLLIGELERAILEWLPEREPSGSDLGPGVVVALDFVSPGENGKELDFKASVNWASRRRHVASWIAQPSDWEDARIDGSLLVRALSPTVDITLSTETGFVKEVRGKKGTVSLVECRIDSELDAAEFVVPAPTSGAQDRSDEMRKSFASIVRRGERVRLYRMASKAAEGEKVDPTDWRRRVGSALTAYHSAALERHHAAWLDKMHARMDSDFDTARARLESSPSDESVRKEIILQSAEWRRQLETILTKTSEGFADSLGTASWAKSEVDRAAEIATIENEAALEAFQQAIAQPLFARYDEGFEQVLAPR